LIDIQPVGIDGDDCKVRGQEFELAFAVGLILRPNAAAVDEMLRDLLRGQIIVLLVLL
jgi:hypothetical protein